MTDFYQLYHDLTPEDFITIQKVRTFMEEHVAPIINDYWLKDEFPFEILQHYDNIGWIESSQLLKGLILMEMARVDPSIATFFLVQNGLAVDSIWKLGTPEQKQMLHSMTRLEKIGCFALTEPDVGSGISGDLSTTARKEGNDWILNGQKKWAGNAVFADMVIIWARDKDNKIKGFMVDTKTQGFKVDKIQNKFGLKCVQNGLITLDNVHVTNVLEGSYKDILKSSRALVGWLATGVQIGAYELALKYAKEREQFGKPIASFQLIQDLLAKILTNVVACQCMMLQLSKLDFTIAQASLAKAFTTARMRESVAWAREIFGGNGMCIDYNIGRFFTDAEAIYTYEGSYQMNNLILGKEITGVSAFV